MKIVAVYEGSRKKCNTAQLLESFLNGVRETAPNTEIEVINLYDYLYSGCKSCFACQLAVDRDAPGCRRTALRRCRATHSMLTASYRDMGQ